MARLRFGDVIELRTAKGLAYCQYTHEHRQYGSLLPVLPGLHNSRPANLSEMAAGSEAFWQFFPLRTALTRKIVANAGNADIPEPAMRFPTFRSGVVDPATGKVAIWWLWDGNREWRVGTLTPEQKRLSVLGVCNDTFLIEKIESGWTPETDSWV